MAEDLAGAIRRIGREIAREATNPTPNVRMEPIEADPLSFTLFVTGPSEMMAPGASSAIPSPYAGKVFECLVKCPKNYPHGEPLDVIWKLGPSGKSTVYHPLVAEDGQTCRNLWKPHWGATSSLATGLGGALRNALAQPTAEAAVNEGAMALLQGPHKNIENYCATAKAAAASLPNASAGGAAGGGGR